ncbi:MAG: TrkA family potassium uptake protein [Chloroflexi bacterium]|nr:TrkA family potassium uptake protein [Chloroflexota bacterium]
MGGLLANQLSIAGHSVVVVDHHEAAFGTLTAEFSGCRIHAHAVELATLRAAKVDQADCVLVTTGKDNINLVVAQIARTTFAVPMVITRRHTAHLQRLNLVSWPDFFMGQMTRLRSSHPPAVSPPI